MASKFFSKVLYLFFILSLSLAAIPAPAFALSSRTESTAVKEHTIKFYFDPALVPDMDFAKMVLVKYVNDMNTILAKNTTRQLVFDPETDIILTSTQPQSNQAAPPLPVEGFEIWAHVVHSNYQVSYGGYAGMDDSGAGVLAGLKWTRLYDPDQLTPNQIVDYWTQINNMLHELAHVFGAGYGEYYNLSTIQDKTETSPLLNINIHDQNDSFWSDKQDFMTDPLLRNASQTNIAGQSNNRENLLHYVEYSKLTAAIINNDYRNGSPTVDLSKIHINVVSEDGLPVETAEIKVWSVAGSSPYQTQLLADDFSNADGELSFAWGGGTSNPHNGCDFLRLIKVYKEGYAATAKYVSIFDADIAKLVDGSNILNITIQLNQNNIKVSSLVRASANPATPATNVDFTVTFSHSVTGVDVSDFSLATNVASDAAVSGISGSGSVYTVTVNTGSDSSTIGLNVMDDDSIKDAALNPLGGIGAGNGTFTNGETYTINKNVEAYIGGNLGGAYFLTSGSNTRQSYAGVDNGPVKVVSTNSLPIISAIRDAWLVNGVTTSFSQLMGLPQEQLSDTYVFPGYNNVTLNDQLRIANVDTTSSTVTVTIGGILEGTYPLAAGAAVRINYPMLDSGPVVVKGTSGVKIISSIREAWAVNETTTSFVQLMGLPAGQLSNKYVFPAYNNVTLNEQLRIGNVDPTQSTSVNVTIHGILLGMYPLGPGEAVRINYPGLDSGPVVVEGTAGVNIIAAIRDAWAVSGVTTSFSQLMGMPAEQLADKYLFPGYNNVTLNDQLRIANVDTVDTSVTVTIGGVNLGTYPLVAGAAVRINYPGLDSGPVVVQGTSGVKIISSIREAWSVSGVTKSFVQLMGLPAQQVSTTYLFPAYNNVTLNEQLRIAVP